MKKYTLIPEEGTELYRLRALKDFGDVRSGDLGGLVAKESNLSHEGECWVYDGAIVWGGAKIFGNAEVYGNANVYDDAEVYGNAWVYGRARVHGNAEVHGNARVFGDAEATTKVLTASGPQHSITVMDKHIAIGCEQHTFEHWLSNYETIGRNNDYDEVDIEFYRAQIEAYVALRRKEV